ncbi:glycosyltransferase [Sphingopyxis sp.]|uniref:glycosyltransferase n=1 Tax=Sphingopyxis sp. TaxID=1908224 RepID=UPI001D8710F0|nr:glycosyltransferase [Sphingopyxis sp.]MBW8295328.1 glycosyltransferase [Sphingopyxis sp.]MBW8295329.1 glycosyltransferase [Sphingopyxis sp.]
MQKVALAVVVIGRNEGKRLAMCLASIASIGAVIYVDSASSDDSVAIARRMGAEIVELDPATPLTAARGRNAGAFRALENDPGIEFIQFVDGDCTIREGWLTKAVSFLARHPNVAVVCGRRFERYPHYSIYNAICQQEWNTPVGEADACGGDSLVRASAFKNVGGFADDQVAHEEPEFCARLRSAGWLIWRIDEPMTDHDAAMYRIGQFYRRSQRAGLGISQCIDRGGASRDRQGQAIVRRAMLWAVVLPVLICVGLFFSPILSVTLIALYPAQILRNALRNWRKGWPLRQSLQVAALSTISKFAEAQGALTYRYRRISGRSIIPILTK